MIIKALILSTMLSSDPAIIIAMPPENKTEAGRRRDKGSRGKRRGGSGLR